MNYILEVKNLRKTYINKFRKEDVVKDISLGFENHQCTGFLGHNGAGKTTTLKMVLGLVKKTSGNILFKGKKFEANHRLEIGFMPETANLNPALNPLEVLSCHYDLQKIQSKTSKKDTLRLKLQQVGLWDHRKKHCGKMSKGMRRRLAWAMATIHEPKLLILDEPFSGLDPDARNEVSEWIHEMKEQKTAIILCTHELWTVPAFCDHVYIMNQGDCVYSSKDDPLQVRYLIKISGSTREDILAAAMKLDNTPNYLEQVGEILEMGFKNYDDAKIWLEFIYQSHMVLIEFITNPVINESQIKSLFKQRRK